MKFTAVQIASFINGRVVGDSDAAVSGFKPIEEGEVDHLSFIAQDKFVHFLDTTECSIIIVSEKFIDANKKYTPTLIVVEDAYVSFQILMNLYQEMKGKKEGIEHPVSISERAKLGEELYIGAFAYVSDGVVIGDETQIHPHVYIGKNVVIGKNCKIDSGVKIYDDCIIGDNCVIHANSVIGGDGFGFQPTEKGYVKIPQLGNVIIENDVEIGSNCSIDRATVGSTVISQGTKIDNLIQIAHNVKMGKHNVIAAQAGIAGSTTIGDWNMIGGQTGIVGHISIGSKVRVQAQSGVNTNVNDGETLYGSPAISASDFKRSYVHFRNFPKIVERINKLEKSNSKQNTNE